MPRGQRYEWPREILERLEGADADQMRAIGDELAIDRSTLYSVRKRVNDFGGIDAFLARSQKRGSRKPRPKRPQTLKEELTRTYALRASNKAGRGFTTQYTVTIPQRMAELYMERFGSREVRFVPLEDGLKIVPVYPFTVDELPGWIPVEALQESDDNAGV